VSETSKKDIMNILGVPEDKVTNTYQAVTIPESLLSLPLDVLQGELRGTFQLEYKNYFLYYGSIEPKKNIGRIIEAYLASNIDMPLVIVGAQAWKAEQELKLLKLAAPGSQYGNGNGSGDGGAASPGRRTVIQLDYVTFPQLVNLVRGALAITFPSLYEGFGLPILEGMVCGTPVITSNMGSMLEVADDAAILVDPYNTREIKDAMIATAGNPDLRAEKVARGVVVAKRFAPEAYRKRLRGLYARIRAPAGAPVGMVAQGA
jgi:glycosyltransferase involved in cell wall biosynthesis